MIEFESLLKLDPSLTFLKGNKDGLIVQTISHFKDPIRGSLLFANKLKIIEALEQMEEFDVGVVVQEDLWLKLEEGHQEKLKKSFTWLATVENVDHAMCKLSKPFYDLMFSELNYFVDGRQLGTAEVHPDAEIAQGVFIGDSCKIGAGVKILPGSVILPHVEIAEGTLIYPNVNIYPFVKIGENCRIHSGTVIGCDGFGYNFFDGHHQKIWHIGGVEIADHVEIGCNTMIDAGTFSPTRIGSFSRIDNDVQISHNVEIRKNVIVCGTTGIAGSVVIEDYCAFGAGAGVAPSAHLEQGVQVAARAAVSANARIKKGETVAGHPARPLREWLKSQATLNRLAKKKV